MTNAFLPFGTAAGANVATAADYSANSGYAAGYQTGVAPSKYLNFTWRQSAFMVSALGQLMSDTGFSAVDDGILANLEGSLASTIRTLAGSVVGSARNLKAVLLAASTITTITADEVVVEGVLGGPPVRIPGFNKSINIASVGATGMDAGAAPVSGFVAIYAIFNPATGVSSLLGTNATSTLAPSIYGGSALPAGYTMSALLAVWPTNASSQLVPGLVVDRVMYLVRAPAFTTATQQTTPSGIFLATSIPPNAREIFGDVQIASTVSSALVSSIAGYSNALGAVFQSVTSAGAQESFRVPIVQAQGIYFTATVGSGTMTFVIYISGYTI